MRHFDVLDRSHQIHQNYFLEASAGTGKTFSIQNIVVRLLIDSNGDKGPLSIHEILVVTFTKAATRDLKVRIRSNIEQALQLLENGLPFAARPDQIPDYLRAYLEKGEKEIKEAKKNLQQALFMYDQAQIFTIHSFCARMLRQFALESEMGLHIISEDKPLPYSELMSVIRDYFRTEMDAGNFSPAQLEILLREDPNQTQLLKLVKSSFGFPSLPPYYQLCSRFNASMAFLKKSLSLEPDKIMEDFIAQAPFYRNPKNGGTKGAAMEKALRFAQLFNKEQWGSDELDQLISDGLVWTKALDPQLLKGNPPKNEEINYPGLTAMLHESLKSIVEEGSSYPLLLARMAKDCQCHLNRYQQEEEKFSPDDILQKMDRALEHPEFCSKVQSQYHAAIIDEFQDTDPVQWKIFKKLFLFNHPSSKCNLYLVGDPKQSIYSFRQADIYTYLDAAQTIGKSNCYSLSVNYRSQPRLVQALNHLFSSEHLPQFFPIPKKSSFLDFHPVSYLSNAQNEFKAGERGAVHFMIADSAAFKNPTLALLEEEIYFPFIANEISRLKEEKNLTYRQFAVLVRDRHQGQRVSEYLRMHLIPTLNQRGSTLADSPALRAMISLIQSLLHPKDRGVFRAVMGSPLMGWTHKEMKDLDSADFIPKVIHSLRRALFEKGFNLFFQEMLQTRCNFKGQTIFEQILSRNGGSEFYHDLLQIADILVEQQYVEWKTPEGIIPFLDRLQVWDQNEDERVQRYHDPSADGVKILSLHISKGLEFDVVFALGLVKRVSIKDDLVPIEKNGQFIMAPLNKESEEYMQHCEEIDSEKMRQLYVACTRAKFQLYIPAALHFPSDHLKCGEASPLDLFLARFRQTPASYPALYDRIRNRESASLIAHLDAMGKDHHITYSLHQKRLCNLQLDPVDQEAPSLTPPPVVAVPGKRLWMTSFTTINQRMEHLAAKSSKEGYPKNFKCPSKTIHNLPASTSTGLLIHSILEKITFNDFALIQDAHQALPLIAPFLRHTELHDWDRVIAELIFNTLKISLPHIPNYFSLDKLKPLSHYREIPFIFPHHHGEPLEELVLNEGLIKGVIDLLFHEKGLYYLVDWKTNWLGPQDQDYEVPSLHQAMQENGYYLQAAIYTEAIKRYFHLVDPRPFKECFGGTYYLFLRGLKPGREAGIMHFFPQGFDLC